MTTCQCLSSTWKTFFSEIGTLSLSLGVMRAIGSFAFLTVPQRTRSPSPFGCCRMTHSKRVSRQISVKSEETDLSDAVPTELQSYSGNIWVTFLLFARFVYFSPLLGSIFVILDYSCLFRMRHFEILTSLIPATKMPEHEFRTYARNKRNKMKRNSVTDSQEEQIHAKVVTLIACGSYEFCGLKVAVSFYDLFFSCLSETRVLA